MEKRRVKQKKQSKYSFEEIDLLDDESPIMITVYGRAGTGKSTFALSGGKGTLLIDVRDQGGTSGIRKNTKRGDITVLRVKNFNQALEALDYAKEYHENFKYVVLDHGTALRDFCVEDVKGDKDKMSQPMWGEVGDMLNEFISLFKGLTDYGVYPIMLAQDRVTTDTNSEGEDQLIPEVGPYLTPAAAKNLCSSSRVVAHTYLYETSKIVGGINKTSVEYRMRLGPDPYYTTKVTKPLDSYCPSYIVNPTLDDIFSIINGEYTEQKQRVKVNSKKEKK